MQNFNLWWWTDMAVVAMTRARGEVEERAEYAHRMLVNFVAASFITLLMITGYWVVNTLVETMAG
jgi:hypothetical protein